MKAMCEILHCRELATERFDVTFNLTLGSMILEPVEQVVRLCKPHHDQVVKDGLTK